MQQIRNQLRTKRMVQQNKLWNHSYLFSILVRQVDYRWNQLYQSLMNMYAKLERFDLCYYMNMPTVLQLPEVNERVAQLSQTHYGDHTLDAISGAGRISKPKLALVFINPTHRNISTRREWDGLKAPWIGCTNIWQLFADAGLIDHEVNRTIQEAKVNWSQDFALNVYNHAAEQGLYITNIVKWAGLDAKLPEKEKIRLYAPLLVEELRLLDANRIIAFGQLTFDGILRELDVKSASSFGNLNEDMLATKNITGVESRVGTIVPCYFPVGQGIKNRAKAVDILKLAAI